MYSLPGNKDKAASWGLQEGTKPRGTWGGGTGTGTQSRGCKQLLCTCRVCDTHVKHLSARYIPSPRMQTPRETKLPTRTIKQPRVLAGVRAPYKGEPVCVCVCRARVCANRERNDLMPSQISGIFLSGLLKGFQRGGKMSIHFSFISHRKSIISSGVVAGSQNI